MIIYQGLVWSKTEGREQRGEAEEVCGEGSGEGAGGPGKEGGEARGQWLGEDLDDLDDSDLTDSDNEDKLDKN